MPIPFLRFRRRWCQRAVIAVSALGPALTAVAVSGTDSRGLSDRLRKGPGFSNHPVGIVPSSDVSVPTTWPLGPSGTIECTTCHDGLPSLKGERVRLRGTDNGVGGFCLNCHTTGDSRTAAAMHWMVVPRAHLLRSDDVVTLRGSIDAPSRRCLGCHDGVTAAESGVAGGWSHGGRFNEPGRNHPIGMSYPQAGVRRAEIPLRPVALLPSAVRLPSGVMSCVSCHDLYAGTPKRLAVPIDGSRLCLACHDLD